jgi:Protein of unknown function (DUF2510)
MEAGFPIPFQDTGTDLPETPFRVKCPACGGMNTVHNPNHNCCFKCGRRMFVSPAEHQASLRTQRTRAEPKPESHGAYAVEMTIKTVAWIIGIGFGLWLLAYSWPLLLAGAVILSPFFIFFYVRSRLRGQRPEAPVGDPSTSLAATISLRDSNYQPDRPRDGEPGWYDDPNTPNWLRYWNGRSWTNQERPAGR